MQMSIPDTLVIFVAVYLDEDDRSLDAKAYKKIARARRTIFLGSPLKSRMRGMVTETSLSKNSYMRAPLG